MTLNWKKIFLNDTYEWSNIYKLKGFMCDQNNLNYQSVTNPKLKGLLV